MARVFHLELGALGNGQSDSNWGLSESGPSTALAGWCGLSPYRRSVAPLAASRIVVAAVPEAVTAVCWPGWVSPSGLTDRRIRRRTAPDADATSPSRVTDGDHRTDSKEHFKFMIASRSESVRARRVLRPSGRRSSARRSAQANDPAARGGAACRGHSGR